MSDKNEGTLRRLVGSIAYLIFFAVLNETMFNVATPMISTDFAVGPSGASWIMTSFMVFFGVGSVVYGRLSELFALRSLISAGVAVYAAGSLLGFAASHSFPLLLAARAVQGIGCSAIPALAFIVIARHVPEGRRGRTFGFITSVVSVGIGIGPVIGGFVAGRLGWPLLFLVPLPVVAAVPLLRGSLLPEERKPGKVDLLGALLVAASVGSLILYLDFGDWRYAAASLGSAIALAIRIAVAAEPFIKPALFANARYRSGLVAGFSVFSAVIGVFFLVPIMLNEVHGLDAGRIGLVLFPGAMSAVLAGPLGGALADRKGNAFAAALGLALLVGSLAAMALLLSGSPLAVAASLVCTYVGFSLVQTAMINGVSSVLPAEETGSGMGVFNLASILAGAVGTAVAGKVLAAGAFAFPLLPLPIARAGIPYSNLLLVFGLLASAGGAAYLRGLRGPRGGGAAAARPEPCPACA